MTGLQAMPALPAVFAALFTTAPTAGAGTGGTEVSASGTAYARQQCAGALTMSGSWTTASTALTLASTAPAWLLALGTVAKPGFGVALYDPTVGAYIGLVDHVSGTTVTLQSTAAHASSGASDTLNFSAFGQPAASTGSDPSIVAASSTTGAAINWPTSTGAGFGSVLFVGFYDAVTAGNFLGGDYLGNFPYIAASVSSASPGVFTSHAHGFSVADSVIATAKYGGTIPSFSQSNFTGTLVLAHSATDTFDVTNASTAVNTSSSGDVMVRKITVQSIPTGVAFTLASGTSISAA